MSRIILGNILESGFDPSQLIVIKAEQAEFEGIRCVPSIESIEDAVDVLVVTVPASAVPDIVEACGQSGKVRSAIIISGGAGETEASTSIGAEIRTAIQKYRGSPNTDTVFLGPNCMGVRSLPGRYDTFFVPADKLPPRRNEAVQPVALISQSGAFIVSRLSSQSQLHPRFAFSIGNQCDLTVSDLLWGMVPRDDVQVVGVYLEGFADLDGMAALKAVSALKSAGKSVVFYKAGRTESGRSAAAGHTAAVAGDYDICQTAMRHAGALVVDNFRDFNQSVDLAVCLTDRTTGSGAVFAVTNAGMEAVSMADAGITFAPVSEDLTSDLNGILAKRCLDTLVGVRNPVDLTPQANEVAYDEVVRAALNAPEVDAVIVSCVPLAPNLKTLGTDLDDPQSLVTFAKSWLSSSNKAIVFAIDGGSEYDPLVQALRAAGAPVFRSADEAARLLQLWISG